MITRQYLAVAALAAMGPALAGAQDLPSAKDLITKWAASVNAAGRVIGPATSR